MSFGFFRKAVNKKLNKLQYRGTNYPYAISFENTKLDWYTSSALNATGLVQNKYYDMSFFPDYSENNPVGTIYIFRLKNENMFDKEMINIFEDAIQKSDTDIRPLLNLLISFHKNYRGKSWETDGEISMLDRSIHPALQITGTIKSNSKKTLDFVFISNISGDKAVIILASLLPWNPTSESVEDIKNIARSVNF